MRRKSDASNMVMAQMACFGSGSGTKWGVGHDRQEP